MQNLAFTLEQRDIAPIPAHIRWSISEIELGSRNVIIRLIRLLAMRFPVVRRLAGDESYLGTARSYTLTRRPPSAGFVHFGKTFPGFLRSLGKSASIEYLADVAALEWARHDARHAPPAAPAIWPQALSELSLQLSDVRVRLHPSASLIGSRFPIVTIWEANRASGEPRVICRWKAEPALVARPFQTIETHRLPPGGYDFFDALRAGSTIGHAVEAGRAAASDFDADANLALLAESKIIIAFR
jgi:Putative DNA-binding domain